MSDGVCDFSIEGDYDGDQPKFFTEKIVKARTPHVCAECRDVIPAGDSYKRVTGKWEATVDTYCFCLPCVEVTGEFMEGGSFGILWEEMANNWADGAHLQACLNRLTTVAAKDHMVRRWKKWKGLP